MPPDHPENVLGHTVSGLVLPRSHLHPIYGPVPPRKFHPGDCTSVNQANVTNGRSLPLRLYPPEEYVINGVVSTVRNSGTLLVDFCRFSGKFRTMSSVTEKVNIPSVD